MRSCPLSKADLLHFSRTLHSAAAHMMTLAISPALAYENPPHMHNNSQHDGQLRLPARTTSVAGKQCTRLNNTQLQRCVPASYKTRVQYTPTAAQHNMLRQSAASSNCTRRAPYRHSTHLPTCVIKKAFEHPFKILHLKICTCLS